MVIRWGIALAIVLGVVGVFVTGERNGFALLAVVGLAGAVTVYFAPRRR